MSELIFSTMVLHVQNTKIGVQLKKARLEKSLSQEQVANRLGVTWEMISRYENGRSSALKHLDKFSDIYGKPVSYFVNDEDALNETFTLENIVSKLSEKGVAYRRSLKNVVKLITTISGKGIDQDMVTSEAYVEVSSTLTDKYETIFALKLGQIEFAAELGLTTKDICFFAKSIEPQTEDVVLAYDGISYKVIKFDPEDLNTALAILISSERRYRE